MVTASHDSLASIPEGKLVRSLLADPVWRDRLLGLQTIPDGVEPYPEVPLYGLGKSGDIDILAVSRNEPEHAVAIQVKRVKVSEQTFRSGKPNRLSAIEELKRQTNLLVDLGFAQVLAFAIVVVDSRAQNDGAYRFDGLTQQLQSAIDKSLGVDGLDPVAGFIQCELVQPMDDRPLGVGTFAKQLRRMPTIRPQAPEVSKWVKQVLLQADA